MAPPQAEDIPVTATAPNPRADEPPAQNIVTTSFGIDPNSIPGPDEPHENSWYNGRDFNGYRVNEQPAYTKRTIKMIIVGAGATGLQIAYKAERLLENIEVVVYEKNNDVGGTWLENRYPGCTCDIPSHSYQFPWARNPEWSAFYSGSEEIWRYFKKIAVDYGLEKYVRFQHRVQSAIWDEEKGKYIVTVTDLASGETKVDEAEILVNGGGILNNWKYPNIPGIESFKGKLMHSAAWDAAYDLTDKTVAVIGGGSSAVQIIPSIQPKVKHITSFLRSPVWVTTGFGAKFAGPGGTNFKYSKEQIDEFRDDPEAFDKYCRGLEGELNKRFTLMHLKSKDQLASRELMAGIMADKLQHDPLLTKAMIPPFGLGCRRMTPGSGYLESLKAENATVLNQGAASFTETGLVAADGTKVDVDVVICATGFDTSFAPPFTLIGRNGVDLRQQFGGQPVGYMAIMTENFPNYYMYLGPNGPASHSSILPILEWHTRYLFQQINKMQQEGIKAIEPKKEVIAELYDHTHELFKRLVWSSACSSWFKNGKKEGPVTAVWAGSRLQWFEVMKEVRWEDFNLTYLNGKNRFGFLGNGYSKVEVGDGDPVWYFDDEFCRT
ncbi:Similar to Putative sterigmatocystin biosynthesis monooxygenase stcW; acc. no. Q00730 [Pyronema omphalodes CBS 100304]|uniref:Similar to Putative sterigmatocystin biosynthesis monooxygenase stcW acc. no. Q00730 n=1 Tax=Pyronema omphalodes (strain CBS 100304) TaxID=1076935 RepID=U4KVW9_PYROM|nr:Similar to Putative sterigmatocystin biosynthesis monooxygenase stcW; acc. no. Q00730 [Pyronema omphalodes CBS 100304]